MMTSRVTLLIFCLIVTVNCSADKPSAPPAEVAVVGVNYIKSHFPHYDSKGEKLTITDGGNSWTVTYSLPKNVDGGAPVVRLNKKTLEVIDAFETQ